MKPLNSGHLRVLKNLSVIKRCALLGGSVTKIVTFGTKHFVRYSRHVRYLRCPLLGGFTVFHFEKILIFLEQIFLFCFLVFCSLIWNFLFYPLKCFIYFNHRSFRSGIVAKDYAGEKAHFPAFTKCFFHLQSFYV